MNTWPLLEVLIVVEELAQWLPARDTPAEDSRLFPSTNFEQRTTACKSSSWAEATISDLLGLVHKH
jgi:outer membrane biogenesis lipoprotein LolB